MSKRLNRSITLHGIVNILLLLIGIFISPHAAIDIQQHDTYLVIDNKQILCHIGIFLLLKNGIVFWYRNKITYQNGLAGVPRRYYRFEGMESFGSLDSTYHIIITLIILIITQILFFIPLAIDLISKKQKLVSDELLDSN